MASRRTGVIIGLLALGAALSGSADRPIAAMPNGDRTLSFFHIHTQETLTVTYKKNGQYVADALKQIDWIMRDWRKNQSTHMDPETIDLIWEMHTELGSQQPVNIICGYRSRDTNEMLRRTVGGQASQSQHITGKAIDITFPDVPLKQIRYSALVRERGGVGYYPTSGIPFIHVDSARVRAWPRLPRFELALLFPDGHTKHMPADGGPITRDDVRIAQSKYHDLAVQVAAYLETRRNPKIAVQVAVAVPPVAPAARQQMAVQVPSEQRPVTPTASAHRPAKFAVASLSGPVPGPTPAAVTSSQGEPTMVWQASPQAPARQPEDAARTTVAALTPDERPNVPKLVSAPRPVERASRFTPGPSVTDRTKLNALVADVANAPAPRLVAEPKPAQRPAKELAAAALPDAKPAARAAAKVAQLEPEKTPDSVTDMSPDTLGSGWVQAPEFDDDHPEELAYRPFPLAPLLTDTDSAHDPQLIGLQHPDVAKTLEFLDDEGAIQPMKFRPGQQVAQVMWAQQFQGKAVHLDALQELDQSRLATGIESRSVKTSAR